MRGYLLIHIGGFKMVYDRTSHLVPIDDGLAVVPDRMVAAVVHERETLEWFDDGWSVGDNARGRFCKWRGPKAKKRFHDYDEAVRYIERLRQKRKVRQEAYTLVYVMPDPSDGKPLHRAVSSMDEIHAFEAFVDAMNTERIPRINEDYPHLAEIRKHFRGGGALRVSSLLASVERHGVQSAVATSDIPKATLHRWLGKLREIGLLK